MRHLDLFSGIGGFALAAAWAGFTTVGFSEIDLYASKVLRRHWPNVQNFGDVRSVPSMSNITLITGGFPCQPFSSAGKRKGREDDRHLWPEFNRIIHAIKPAWVVAENVTGIIDMELDNVLDDLERAGYETGTYIIPASAIGAPHRRERVWIVAHSLRERCHNGIDHAAQHKIQDNWQRDIATSKSEWSGLFPKSWSTFDLKSWLQPITDPNSVQRETSSTNPQAMPKRSERSDTSRENSLSSNANGVTSEQANSETFTVSTERDTRERHTGLNRKSITQLDWDENEPPFPGVDDGLSHIVDRNKSLGNAIVPQVVYPILRAIALMEKSKC